MCDHGNRVFAFVFFQFFFSPVLLRVADGVAFVAVGFHFQQRWATFFPGSFHRSFHSFVYGFGVHAIHFVGGHFVGIGQFVNVHYVAGSFYGSAHGVVVIFTNENDWQLPQHGHVECFVQHTLPCCAIAKESQHHIVCAFVLLCKGKPCTCAYLRTHYSVSAKEIFVNTKKVHAAAFAFGAACGFAIQFGHTFVGSHTFCQSPSMIAVGGYERIFLPGSGHATCCQCFLTHIGMKEATDFTRHLVLFLCL